MEWRRDKEKWLKFIKFIADYVIELFLLICYLALLFQKNKITKCTLDIWNNRKSSNIMFFKLFRVDFWCLQAKIQNLGTMITYPFYRGLTLTSGFKSTDHFLLPTPHIIQTPLKSVQTVLSPGWPCMALTPSISLRAPELQDQPFGLWSRNI